MADKKIKIYIYSLPAFFVNGSGRWALEELNDPEEGGKEDKEDEKSGKRGEEGREKDQGRKKKKRLPSFHNSRAVVEAFFRFIGSKNPDDKKACDADKGASKHQ